MSTARMTPERIKELRSLYQDRSTNARDVIHECLDEIERMKQGTETAMTNPARQAAERIAKDTTPWYGLTRANPDWVEEVVQEAINSATAELKAKYYRSLEDITRERDEAREAARELWKEYIRRGPESSNFSQRFPWLRETT